MAYMIVLLSPCDLLHKNKMNMSLPCLLQQISKDGFDVISVLFVRTSYKYLKREID